MSGLPTPNSTQYIQHQLTDNSLTDQNICSNIKHPSCKCRHQFSKYKLPNLVKKLSSLSISKNNIYHQEKPMFNLIKKFHSNKMDNYKSHTNEHSATTNCHMSFFLFLFWNYSWHTSYMKIIQLYMPPMDRQLHEME